MWQWTIKLQQKIWNFQKFPGIYPWNFKVDLWPIAIPSQHSIVKKQNVEVEQR